MRALHAFGREKSHVGFSGHCLSTRSEIGYPDLILFCGRVLGLAMAMAMLSHDCVPRAGQCVVPRS